MIGINKCLDAFPIENTSDKINDTGLNEII